ncbi:hypothetical protein BN7_5443 [Wickerhamomyces ciferrii]|uniref:F-box domain-containing protein n=1 Tax=Wickerhamomyces ciferrii (strain ATCC 14091 / BCRC 22168 / CBS 111 / JCM 3599 / NBRC 0793 / NRRL Y-1031 F-60-10) TaxID=1206466 RepID=K0KRV1_WICCF|nr:uncharacterized protein BN7_5443 [Wickerhamomyces ciferrii]CCH45856.1 hypothetical protein BN7_5443 [Wickerhamomyces ciferrii]
MVEQLTPFALAYISSVNECLNGNFDYNSTYCSNAFRILSKFEVTDVNIDLPMSTKVDFYFLLTQLILSLILNLDFLIIAFLEFTYYGILVYRDQEIETKTYIGEAFRVFIWKWETHVSFPIRFYSELFSEWYDSIKSAFGSVFKNDYTLIIDNPIPFPSDNTENNNEINHSSETKFPPEIWALILYFTPRNDLLNVMLVNHLFLELGASRFYEKIHCIAAIYNKSIIRNADRAFLRTGNDHSSPNPMFTRESDINVQDEYDIYKRQKFWFQRDKPYDFVDFHTTNEQLYYAEKFKEDPNVQLITKYKQIRMILNMMNNEKSIMRKYIKEIKYDVVFLQECCEIFETFRSDLIKFGPQNLKKGTEQKLNMQTFDNEFSDLLRHRYNYKVGWERVKIRSHPLRGQRIVPLNTYFFPFIDLRFPKNGCQVDFLARLVDSYQTDLEQEFHESLAQGNIEQASVLMDDCEKAVWDLNNKVILDHREPASEDDIGQFIDQIKSTLVFELNDKIHKSFALASESNIKHDFYRGFYNGFHRDFFTNAIPYTPKMVVFDVSKDDSNC